MSKRNGYRKKSEPRVNFIVNQKGSKSEDRPHLTQKESQILSLLTHEFLTVPQVAVRLKVSKRAVYKHKKSLEEKGYLGLGIVNGSQRGAIVNPVNPSPVRLHGLQWKVKPLHPFRGLQKRVIPDVLGCHVVVNEYSIEIYSKKDVVFVADTESLAMASALAFFSRLGILLENDLNVKLVKPRSQNWFLVKSEWATENSGVAEVSIRDGNEIKVFGSDDGKLWFWCDWSKKFPEHEASNKVDSELVNLHLNDWRDYSPPTSSQIAGLIKEVLELQREQSLLVKEQAAALSVILDVLRPVENKDFFEEKNSKRWYHG